MVVYASGQSNRVFTPILLRFAGSNPVITSKCGERVVFRSQVHNLEVRQFDFDPRYKSSDKILEQVTTINRNRMELSSETELKNILRGGSSW